MQRKKYFMIVLFIFVIVFLIVVNVFIYGTKEVEQCKNFLTENNTVKNFFGDVTSIKYRFVGSGKHKDTRKGLSGYYSFKICGDKHKGLVKVKWREENNQLAPILLSTREGLCGNRILWPESQAKSSGYILRPNIWDGIILLVLASISYFFHINAKRNSKLFNFFYPSALRFESNHVITAWGFLVTTFGCVIYSILCFLNIFILF